MSLDFSAVNYLAVIVAAVAHMVLGFLWYSPVLLGNVWMKQVGIKKEEMKGAAGPIIGSMVLAIVISLILALLLHMAGLSSMGGLSTSNGITLGVLVGLIVAAVIGINYLFEKGKLILYFISVGNHFVGIVIMSLILVLWK